MKIRISRNLFLILVIDIVLIYCSLYFSHSIRFDFQIPGWAMKGFEEMLPYVMVVKLPVFTFLISIKACGGTQA